LYRSAAGQQAIRAWCTDRLDGWGVAHEPRERATALGSTHLITAGSGGPTAVLVPGTNLNAATNLDLIGALAEHRRVVALDLPGQPGLSAANSPGKDRITIYGHWLDGVLAALDDGPYVLVGHSLGAAVVLAGTPSDQIAGILLVDPAGLVKATIRPSVLATSTAWFLRPSDARSHRLIERMQAPGHPAPPDLAEWFTLVGRHTRSEGAPRPVGDAVLARWRDTPRAVLTGADDTFFPPAKLTRAAIQSIDTNAVVVPDAGHLLPHEHPQTVVDAVLALT
jgi:pimeloyl-ACP methyl ester carboxylesterase